MATIEEVYRELNFPSIRKLAIALRSRQIPFTPEELENLTRTNEVNQIYQGSCFKSEDFHYTIQEVTGKNF